MTSDETLWQFSLNIYTEAGVKDACLFLQDKYHADINLLLFLLFQGQLQQQLSLKTIQQIDNEIRPFREQITQPIRELRKRLKGKKFSIDNSDYSLYQSMLSFELSAEKLTQAQLSYIKFDCEYNSVALQASVHNLYCYAELLHIPKTSPALNTLLSALQA